MFSRPKTNKMIQNITKDGDFDLNENEEVKEAEASPKVKSKTEERRRAVFKILTSCNDLMEEPYDNIDIAKYNNLK